MAELIKFNNEGYRCNNCQSPKCIRKLSEDGVMVYYECCNCGHQAVVDYRLPGFILRDHLNKISEQRNDKDGQF